MRSVDAGVEDGDADAAPLLVFHGPVGEAPGMLSPKPPACWTAQPCGEL